MNRKTDDSGVSDIIGVMLMISIVVISLGIIGTFLFSMITIQSIPQVDLQVSKVQDTTNPPEIKEKVHILMERGEPLDPKKTVIRINKVEESSDNFTKVTYDQSVKEWKSEDLNAGDLLISPSKDSIDSLDILYDNGKGGSILLKTFCFANNCLL